MDCPDVNILVTAFRPDSEAHLKCRAWLENRITGQSSLGVIPWVLAGFLRIVTHPKVFYQPSPLEEAIAFCDFIRTASVAVILNPGERHWEIFLQLSRSRKAVGNLIPDLWLAAIAIEHGCTWITLDKDFSRFPGLRVAAP